MNEEQFNLDIENIKKEIPKLEYWIKEENLILNDLKEIYQSLKQEYTSNNQDILFYNERKLEESLKTINDNNNKFYKVLENELEIHNRIKRNLNTSILSSGDRNE